MFCKKIEELDKGLYLVESILAGETHFNFSELNAARNSTRAKMLEEIQKTVGPPPAKKKKGKKKGGENTFEITIRLFKAGLSVPEIAEERVLAISTIEEHIIRAIGEGRIPIQLFLEEEQIAIISEAIEGMPKGFTSTDLFRKLEGKFTYNQLRAVMNHLEVTAHTGD